MLSEMSHAENPTTFNGIVQLGPFSDIFDRAIGVCYLITISVGLPGNVVALTFFAGKRTGGTVNRCAKKSVCHLIFFSYRNCLRSTFQVVHDYDSY